jgi:hypothetical protein
MAQIPENNLPLRSRKEAPNYRSALPSRTSPTKHFKAVTQ